MSTRSCPVCDTPSAEGTLFLDERLDPSRLNALSFASRKPPEFMNHRLVRCSVCDLVFADQPPDQRALADAYHASAFDSGPEADDAAVAYLREIAPVIAALPARDAALEIGCGTGTFLAKLQAAGFAHLCGVEPSREAIDAAPSERRAWIREDIFRPEHFEPSRFDLVVCFMTLEHVREPGELARAVSRLLKPGGAFVVVVHDWRAALNRVLGRRSPIIDIEHMQLFSTRSVEQLLRSAGLTQVTSASFANRYALRYWARLMPLPDSVKRALHQLLTRTGWGERRLSVNVGNRMCVGWRPLVDPP